MIAPGGIPRVFVATRPIDFRKGHDGLALAVAGDVRSRSLLRGSLRVRSKRADRIRILVWDQTSLVLVHKRLEGGRFVWPQVRDGVMRTAGASLCPVWGPGLKVGSAHAQPSAATGGVTAAE